MEPADDPFPPDSSISDANPPTETNSGDATKHESDESQSQLSAVPREETQPAGGETIETKAATSDMRQDSKVSEPEAQPEAEPNKADPVSESKTSDDTSKAEDRGKEHAKPVVLKVEQQGVYTFKTLQGTNFFKEWYKAAKVSGPYLFRLFKLFWKQSPTRVSVLIAVNILRASIPSLTSWRVKQFLDEIQYASLGNKPRVKWLVALVFLSASQDWLLHLLNMISDKASGVLETRFSRELNSMLIKANLELDSAQLKSPKVSSMFGKASEFAGWYPSRLIFQWIELVRYLVSMGVSSYTLSRMISKDARNLFLLNLAKASLYLYCLFGYYAGVTRIDILNNDYHRMTKMRSIALDSYLRPEVGANGMGPWLISQLQKASNALGDISIKPYYENLTYNVPLRYTTVNSLLAVITSGNYLWFLYEGLRKGVSLGTLELVRSSSDDVITQLWNVSGQVNEMSRQWANVIAFFRCLELKSEMKRPAEPIPYERKEAGMKIEARDIHFKYDPESNEEVLKGVSFVIEAGKMVAIVGSNGSGKSTLANLLSRQLNITSGELLFNDVNGDSYDPASLRQHISILFQETGQFWGLTLAENIGLGNAEKIGDPSAVEEAAKAAGANEFIEKLEFKYDSYLGSIPGSWTWTQGIKAWNEDGYQEESEESDEVKELQRRVKCGVSGGELQKIGLARAFMREANADLMILDEPSAKLDPEAELNLFETVKKVRSGKTTVFVSHRFNTVKMADQILVFENGSIKEVGTHDELMAIKDGKYRKLYTIQAKGFYPEDE